MITLRSILNELIVMSGIFGALLAIMLCANFIYKIYDSIRTTILRNIFEHRSDKREREQKAKKDATENFAKIVANPKANISECSKCHSQFGYFYEKILPGYPHYPLYCPKCGRKFNGIDWRM